MDRAWTRKAKSWHCSVMTIANFRHFPSIVLFCVVSLIGCVSTPEGPPNRDLRFGHLGVVPLDVSDMSVVVGYRAPLKEPHLDHDLRPTPTRVLRNWAEDRLRPRGGVMRGRFVVEDASLEREVLETDKGFSGIFKKEQAERFVIRLRASILIYDRRGGTVARVRAGVERFRTAPEGVTLNERDDMLFDLIVAAMADFDSEMTKQIKIHLDRWIHF